MDNNNLPQHIAIIPDGNRRWSREHKMHNFLGHQKGLDTMFEIAKYARYKGVKYFTLWFFSTENWNRSPEEVAYLMNLAEKKIKSVGKKLMEEEVRFTHLGRKDRIPKSLAESFIRLEKDTAQFSEKYLNLAFDYGGRDDLITAFQSIMKSGINSNEISEELISKHLYSKGMPDPDLIIRPGGESRLSGYLAWQSVYSELYFCKTYAPDFNSKELDKALEWYASIDRRKGGNSKSEDSKFKKV